MDKLTYEEIILAVLEENKDWTPSYNLIKVNTKWGWLGSGADRTARALALENIIQRKREGKYTYFRLLTDKQPSLI